MRILKAIKYSIQGYKSCYKTEPAFREELMMAGVLIPFAIYFADSKIEFVILIGAVFVVLITELINTSIERAIDRIGPETHPLARDSKDIASAAVLTSLIMMGIVWVIVLIG